MPHESQEIEGFGVRLRFVKIDDTVLVMEATYDGAAGLPPEHSHPNQAERFEVLEGAMRAIVDGTERRYEDGDVFDVAVATPHQLAADGPARVRWEVRPALRTAEFFERLYGTGPDSLREAASFIDFFNEFADEIRLTGA